MVPSWLGPAADQGSVVLGWLSRLVLTFAILGLIGFEVMSIAVVHVQVEDIGRSAAQEAIETYQETQNPELAYQAADVYAASQDSEIDKASFEITPESVSFTLEKVAPTLLLYRWSKTAGLAHVETPVYSEPIEMSGQLS